MAKPLDEWIASDMHHVQRRSLSRLSERCSFRDPVRPIHADASYFFSPTDGVILYQRTLGATDTLLEIKGRTYSLREALRDSTFDARCLVIGIFMTLYDAPVNRVPIAGILDFRLLPPIDDCNHPTLAVEESLLHGGKAAMGEAEYLFSNQRMLNRIYAPTLGLTYYLLQIADYDVSAILPFDQDQQRHYAQGDRFSEIRYGSQVDLIIPVSRRWRFETLLPDSTHVEAGLDPLVCINHVPLGLRHLLALGIAHQRVDVHLPERHAVILLVSPPARLLDGRVLLMSLHKVASEHDHARHPEEQDLVRRDQQRRRIKHSLIARFLRPAQRRKRQQSR